VRKTTSAFGSMLLSLLAACGGGGSSSNLGGGGGGGGTSNVATVTVDGGPAGVPNTAFVSVTVCVPGSTTNCQTIDGIEVDTGSVGFRVIASVLNSTLAQALPTQVAGEVPVVECTQFADGYSWGPVKTADITIAGEQASSVPIQVMGDPSFTSIPSDCSTPVPNEEDTVQSFGANGIIGIGYFAEDCGSFCTTAPAPAATYYTCAANAATCTSTPEPLNLQVANPIPFFTASGDTNGSILQLPSATDGETSVTGSLIFGIGTQSNNALGSATVLPVDPNFGYVDIQFNGTDYPQSYLDSGSNANYFTDSSLSVCATGTAGAGWYCSDASNLMATISGINGTPTLTAAFSVANATNLFTASPTGMVFPELGAPIPNAAQTFDFGLAYFYSRKVFTAIEGANTPGGMGPYLAY
jgi:hypothetical protein